MSIGPFFHTDSTSVITGGGVGTAGTLTFDNTLDLAGGVLRADLDQTATSYDKIVVSQNGGFGASGSPGGSVVDIEFMGTLPTAKTTFSIVNYSGNFNGRRTMSRSMERRLSIHRTWSSPLPTRTLRDAIRNFRSITRPTRWMSFISPARWPAI